MNSLPASDDGLARVHDAMAAHVETRRSARAHCVGRARVGMHTST